ncbi:MAG: PEP-CTERM sorting domain-containing protein [Cephaloticoccus sp.]|nr:PEP-CTERM sorting domain-containing protein [Cephaloticoccus sp.]MCF7760340.1 PEP-CTERM sorting domain-containing protein [Cephaloticoccus sp.]
MPRLKLPLFCLALIFSPIALSAQTILVSNLGEASNSGPISSISPSEWFANSFTTGSEQVTLSSVTLALHSGTTATGFSLQLYSDNAGNPGSSLETLAGTSSPTGGGNFTYTSSGTSLLNGTTYWLVTSSTVGNVRPYGTASHSETGEPGWLIGDTFYYTNNSGATWTAGAIGAFFDPLRFSVATAAVPEPSTYAVIAGALVFGCVVLRRRRTKLS